MGKRSSNISRLNAYKISTDHDQNPKVSKLRKKYIKIKPTMEKKKKKTMNKIKQPHHFNTKVLLFLLKDIWRGSKITCLQGIPSFLSLRVLVTRSFCMSPISASSFGMWVSTPFPTPVKNSGIPTFTANKTEMPWLLHFHLFSNLRSWNPKKPIMSRNWRWIGRTCVTRVWFGGEESVECGNG